MMLFVARRLKEMEPPIPKALLNVCHVLADALSTTSLCYLGSPGKQVELSEKSVNHYLARLQLLESLLVPTICCFADGFYTKKVRFFLEKEEESIGLIERIQIFSGLPTLEKAIHLVGGVGQEFGAFHCYDEYSELANLYGRSKRIRERQLKIYPEDHPGIINLSEPKVVGKELPELLLSDEFNYRYVPDGVCWVNFWDKTQVETVGVERIRKAPWARIIQQPTGAMVLVATETATDIENPAHIEQLRQIVECINLREAQEQYRLS
jgi:hypothetical protein